MNPTKGSSQNRHSEPTITVRRMASAGGLTTANIIRAVREALGDRPVIALNVAVVSDAQIARLHEEFMDDDRPTDVLTFDLRDDLQGEAIEGEIVVSADTARREADRRGLDRAEELTRYVIHGVLHLLGLDDQTPGQRQRMRREENRVLQRLASRSVSGSGNTKRGSRKASRPPARFGPLRKKR